MVHSRSRYDFPWPQDSPTFVRVSLTGVDGQGLISCCGEAPKPAAECLTNKWSVYLQNHIPQPVFDAMMHDIYNGPKYNKYLSIFYSPLHSVGCFLLSFGLAPITIHMWNYNQMKAEVAGKLRAWNGVLSKHRCGVTMQINRYGLIFNILPEQVLDDYPGVQKQMLIELDLKHKPRTLIQLIINSYNYKGCAISFMLGHFHSLILQ